MQEAYFTAFKNIDTLEDDSRFPQWMSMIVANKAKDFLRKKNPVMFIEPNELFDVEEDRDYVLPEKCADNKDLRKIVNKLIDKLPQEQKIVTLLYYYNGLLISEISSTLNCSENTVIKLQIHVWFF